VSWYTWLGFAAGLFLVIGTWFNVITVLVLPRRGRSRIQRHVGGYTATVFNTIAGRFASYETRDRVLAYHAPFFLMVLLGVWELAFLVGFALIAWPFVHDGGFIHALVLSGSSLLTLGFASDPGAGARFAMLSAAASGLITVALLIGYLPVIYAAYSRRETLVTMLEARAGVPSWGPELLARHELIDGLDRLGPLYADWERWAADMAESHQTYPVLLWFRSPDPKRSWIIGLLSVLDAAAIQLATQPLTAPAEARPFMRMGYTAMRDVAVVVGMRVDEDPKPDDAVRLSKQSFLDAMHHLEHVGWRFERDVEEAWVHFRGWRVNYESLAYALADGVNAAPALWSGGRRGLPDAAQPPERPPHRQPPVEVLNVKKITKQRRAIRRGDAVPIRRDVHDALHGADPEPEQEQPATPHAHDAQGHDMLHDARGVGDDSAMIAEPEDPSAQP
jgi:hypothetical protein